MRSSVQITCVPSRDIQKRPNVLEGMADGVKQGEMSVVPARF